MLLQMDNHVEQTDCQLQAVTAIPHASFFCDFACTYNLVLLHLTQSDVSSYAVLSFLCCLSLLAEVHVHAASLGYDQLLAYGCFTYHRAYL